jgi:hypothetical protein
MDSLNTGIVIGVSSTLTLCCILLGIRQCCKSRNHSYLKESRSDTDLASLDTDSA